MSGPPFFFLSTQYLHVLQSSSTVQPEHCPQRTRLTCVACVVVCCPISWSSSSSWSSWSSSSSSSLLLPLLPSLLPSLLSLLLSLLPSLLPSLCSPPLATVFLQVEHRYWAAPALDRWHFTSLHCTLPPAAAATAVILFAACDDEEEEGEEEEDDDEEEEEVFIRFLLRVAMVSCVVKNLVRSRSSASLS